MRKPKVKRTPEEHAEHVRSLTYERYNAARTRFEEEPCAQTVNELYAAARRYVTAVKHPHILNSDGEMGH